MIVAVILLSVVVTATISGVFGMAGGMILMAIYLALLPVPEAMVLHGVTQFASNGFRAWLLRDRVERRIVGVYTAGAVAAACGFALAGVVLPARVVFISLGAIPLVVSALPKRVRLDIEGRVQAVLCGVVVTGAQLVAGASGPLLDVFYVRSSLERHAIIGTKAVTQALGHALKLVYFGWIVSVGELSTLPLPVFVCVIPCALIGTRIGKGLLGRMSDRQFRGASTWIVRVLAIALVARGLSMGSPVEPADACYPRPIDEATSGSD